MFEDKTYEKILAEDLASVPGEVNRREGSFVFAALSALALEVEKLYLGMNYTIEMAYASTADYEHLVLLCGDRGIIPYDASRVRAEGVFNLPVPAGARFSIAGLIYRVVEVYEDPEYEHAYVMECETAGSGANGVIGKLTAITFISGLERAELVKVLVAGRDAQTKEELYERYRLSFSEESYGGNVQEYKEKVNSQDGVGGCKVYPVWNGAGTVKVIVIGADLTAPSDYLVQELQEMLCPEPALGYGLAPIDHDVTVEAVEETGIRVVSDITFQKNYSQEVCQKDLDDAVKAYLASIAAEWADGTEEDISTVYLAKVQSVLLDVAGVQDVSNTTLNGEKVNVVLASSQIPVLEGECERMKIDTIRHFPEHLGRMREYRIIAEIYDRRLSMVLADLMTVMDNQYLSTMDAEGCRRREEILGITCNPTDTLDERIRRIKGYYSSNRPYTVKKVKEILCSMCGDGNYTLRIDRSVRDIQVGIALNTVNMVDHVREIMGHIRPANMTLEVMILYNDHWDLAHETHGALAAFTHGGLRMDPALDRTDYGGGSMKYTEHFGLKKPDVDDFYDIGDHNDNVDVIDEMLYQMQEDVSGISGQMSRAVVVTVPSAGWQAADPAGDADAGDAGTGFVVTIPVEGMSATDLPVVLLDSSGAASEVEEKTLKKQYGWISWYDTAEGEITFTARFHQPTVDLALILKGV